jgi:anti-sigma factor RsiW
VRCDFADSLLQGYFDGELSTASAAVFERHLQHCVDCAVELVDLDLLSGQLQFAQLYASAPASLRKKIRANLHPVAPTTSLSQPLLWRWLAAAAALLLLAIAGWRANSVLRTDDYQAELAEEIVDAHVHSLQPGQLIGISSNDEQAVKGWFSGKLTFALPVHDFANDGFALQGGRVDVLEGRPVAVLVYGHPGHLIDVFIWPRRERDTSPRVGSRQGYRWIDWRKGEIEFCAVSDTDPADLEQLHQLINSSAWAKREYD